MRNQPITRVRAKMGVELDRKRAREESGRLVERRHCCSHAKTWRRRKLSSPEQRSWRGETLNRSRRVEGPSDSGVGRGATVSSCPSRAPEPSGIPRPVWLGILLQKLRKMEKKRVSHTQKSSKLTQQDVLCDLERERGKTKGDTTLEAVDMATFLNSKLESRLCI